MKRKLHEPNLHLLISSLGIDLGDPVSGIAAFKAVVTDRGMSSGEVRDFLLTKECLSLLTFESFWLLHQCELIRFIEYLTHAPSSGRVSARLRAILLDGGSGEITETTSLSLAADVCQYIFREMRSGKDEKNAAICENVLDHIFTYFDASRNLREQPSPPVAIPITDIIAFRDVALILMMSVEQDILISWLQKHLSFILHGVIELPPESDTNVHVLLEDIERLLGVDAVVRCIKDLISRPTPSMFDLRIRKVYEEACINSYLVLAIQYFLNTQQVNDIVEAAFKLALKVSKNEILIRSFSFAELVLSHHDFNILVNNLFGPVCSVDSRGVRIEPTETSLDIRASEFLFLTLCEMVGYISTHSLTTFTNAVKTRRGNIMSLQCSTFK